MNRRSGLTLVELVVVLTILVALAAIIVPILSGTAENAQTTVTQSNLRHLADVVVRYRVDMHRLPRRGFNDPTSSRLFTPQLRFLFVNPGSATAAWTGQGADPTGTSRNTFDPFSKMGWNGPYMPLGTSTYAPGHGFTNEFGEAGDPVIADMWGRPVVLVTRVTTAGQSFTWLQSAGPNGVLEVPNASALTGPPHVGVGQPGLDANTNFPGVGTVDDVTVLLPITE